MLVRDWNKYLIIIINFFERFMKTQIYIKDSIVIVIKFCSLNWHTTTSHKSNYPNAHYVTIIVISWQSHCMLDFSTSILQTSIEGMSNGYRKWSDIFYQPFISIPREHKTIWQKVNAGKFYEIKFNSCGYKKYHT